jgi:hypothetical protein
MMGHMKRLAPLLSLLLLAACGGDEGTCKRDAGCDGPVKQGDLGPPRPDLPTGPWQCGAPVQTGGAVSCSFTWDCSVGKRQLVCDYDVVNNVFDCVCLNLTKNKPEGTFDGPSQTCSIGVSSILKDANASCKWKLPGG